ncbi:hypothetical protein HMPREF1409_00206 [Helicobacter pylori GAM246Ai]|nr:hypothetical protein HMPREF1409_00206 [Helicobacter pylori GAM246Ai]
MRIKLSKNSTNEKLAIKKALETRNKFFRLIKSAKTPLGYSATNTQKLKKVCTSKISLKLSPLESNKGVKIAWGKL